MPGPADLRERVGRLLGSPVGAVRGLGSSHAWTLHRASLDDGITRRRRLLALVSVRSFGRYHVRDVLRRGGSGSKGAR